MGSVFRGTAIEKFVRHFNDKVASHFEERLVGATIKSLTDVKADYYVKGVAHLSNGEAFDVHYRWTSQEEDAKAVELDADYPKMSDYYAEHLIGKQILSVRLGDGDRDDEAYLLAHVSDQHCLEIPLGFDPERGTLDSFGYAAEIVTQTEFKALFEILDVDVEEESGDTDSVLEESQMLELNFEKGVVNRGEQTLMTLDELLFLLDSANQYNNSFPIEQSQKFMCNLRERIGVGFTNEQFEEMKSVWLSGEIGIESE